MSEIDTTRGRMYYRERGARNSEGPRALLVHGNVSSSAFFEPLLDLLPSAWHVLAPDLRGYGGTEAAPIDARRGLREWSDDLWAFLEAVGWKDSAFHLLGWSMGGGIAVQMARERPERLRSLILVAPLSPFGFGGTRDAQGTPTTPDCAGSGGGTVNPTFVECLAAGDRGSNPSSPRTVLRSFYFGPDYVPPPTLEEDFVTSMLSTRVGEDYYPGDFVPSTNWPNVAPGTRGINNAMSPAYVNLSDITDIASKPSILWIRGAHDQIVSDRSLFDLPVLGEMGLVPGWPGVEEAPPQPMLSQTRAVFAAYAAGGGRYREEVFAHSGHSPHVEESERFRDLLVEFVQQEESSAR